MKLENNAKKNAKVLLFVIDSQTRNIATIVEVAESAAKNQHRLLLVQGKYEENQEFEEGKVISQEWVLFVWNEPKNKQQIMKMWIHFSREYTDLSNGLSVIDFILKEEHIQTFDDLGDALANIPKVRYSSIHYCNV